MKFEFKNSFDRSIKTLPEEKKKDIKDFSQTADIADIVFNKWREIVKYISNFTNGWTSAFYIENKIR